MNIILFLLVAAAITASGQLLMKKGSQVLREIFGWQENYQLIPQLINKVFAIIFEPHIFIALLLYSLGLFLWLKILTRTELSYAYPLLVSFTILITSLSSFFIFKETIAPLKILGMIFIITGIFFITTGKI